MKLDPSQEPLSKFSQEDFDNVFKKISKLLMNGKKAEKNPIAIVLGGQPGSGKRNIYDYYRNKLSGNIVEVDCDNFRRYHPNYHKLYNKYSGDDSDYTQKFVNDLSIRLSDEAREKGYNVIIESTLRTPTVAEIISQKFMSQGYYVYLCVMSTPSETSLRGIEERKQQMIAENKQPRSVTRDFHDSVVSSISDSLDVVYKSGTMSNIQLFNREKECLYDMKKTPDINPSMILDSIIKSSPSSVTEPVKFKSSLSNIEKIKKSKYPYSIDFKEGKFYVAVNKSDKQEIINMLNLSKAIKINEPFYIGEVTEQQKTQLENCGITCGYNPKSAVIVIEKKDKALVESVLQKGMKIRQ